MSRREVLELVAGALEAHLVERAPAVEADLEKVLDPADPALLGGLADHLLDRVEVGGEQRPRQLREVAHLAAAVLQQLRQPLHQLVKVQAEGLEPSRGLPEGLAQVVVEARPEEVEELVVGRDLLAALDHGGAQRVAEDLAVLDRELVEGLEGVDGLGGGDADPALAEDVGELEDLLLHAGAPGGGAGLSAGPPF